MPRTKTDADSSRALHGPAAWTAADWLLDRPALWAVLKVVLPTSRLWAAAMAAEGDLDRLVAEAPVLDRADRLLAWRLAGFEKRRRRFAAAVGRWEESFFGGTPGDLAALETERARAALSLTLQRLRFLDVVARRPVPPVRFAIPALADVEAAYGSSLAEPWRAYLPGPMPAVEESRRLGTTDGDDYWIRFPSTGPRIAGLAWARVHEPRGIRNPPSLIFSNGICIEPDDIEFTGLVRKAPGGIASLSRLGIRVVEIELPWHGRRRRLGSYGGEPFLATPPLGPLDLFSTHAQDIAIVTAWCRGASTGRVGIAGASLGAIASLLAASHAAHWPAAMRPDALALMTAADDVIALSTTSALAHGVGVPAALRAAGWTRDALARWRPFLAVAARAPLPPERIVAVLGRRDVVLPFASGASLVARWGVPDGNVFVGEAGHFSTQAGAVLDRRPIRRILEILDARPA